MDHVMSLDGNGPSAKVRTQVRLADGSSLTHGSAPDAVRLYLMHARRYRGGWWDSGLGIDVQERNVVSLRPLLPPHPKYETGIYPS